ncbi:PrsW family intramembrane metalloprotease [Gluconacetobacter sp. 1c LMG 22058]|uniref:PrsW family intramembrane metalloprotease n=1 Tax=Gluconacetobacter dulcium TaxID=2729096 RepID=A0A7W4JWH0_9PROT|nr:PrsW family intramembrane metalloprotease [Gluconacetobacter dulcium]
MKIYEIFFVCFSFGVTPIIFLRMCTNLKYKSDDIFFATIFSIFIFILSSPIEHAVLHIKKITFYENQSLFYLLITSFAIGTIEEFTKLFFSIQLSKTRKINILTAAILIGCITGDFESLLYNIGTFNKNSLSSILNLCVFRPFLHSAFTVLTVALYIRISNKRQGASLISATCVGILHGIYNIFTSCENGNIFLLSAIESLFLIIMLFIIINDNQNNKKIYFFDKLFFVYFVILSLISSYLPPDPHMRILSMVPVSSYSIFLLFKYFIRSTPMYIAADR